MKKFILSFIMMLSLALLWNGGGKEVKAASNSYVCTSTGVVKLWKNGIS